MGATKGRTARETGFRWAVLAMMFIAIYSFVYCYDNPNAMQNELIREYGLTQVQYNMLYSIYGYVNMIAPLIAGMLIDCIGIYSSTLGFYILIVIGQTLWVLGTMNEGSYPLMVVGRAIFGVGAEQYHTSRKWLCYEYFTSAEYMLASGLTLSASRFGSATQSYATTVVYNKHGITAALAIGWGLVVFSLILTIVFTIYQKYYYKKQETDNAPQKQPMKTIKGEENAMDASGSPSPNDDDWDRHKEQDWKKFQLTFLCKKSEFDIRFWLFGLMLICFYSTYLAYSNVGSAFIQARYQKAYEDANFMSPIMFWIAAIFTPIQGFLCDYYGKRMPFMVLASVLLLLGHIFLGFIGNAERSDAFLIIGLLCLGFGYSVGAGSCWPCCGIIVKQKYLATSLGFWACVDNGFQACMFLSVAGLTETYSKEEYAKESPNPARIHEYDDARWLWIALAIATMISSLLLWFFDRRNADNILMIPEEKWAIKRGVHETKAQRIPKDDMTDEEDDPNDMLQETR
eukprot:90099_1